MKGLGDEEGFNRMVEYLSIMETITGNGFSAEDRFQVQTKQGNLLLEV